MIESLLIKEHLSFLKADVKFKNGLIVFTGASGAGKSVFFNALLSVFGLSSSDASLIEAVVDSSIDSSCFGVEPEDVNVFKCYKQKSMRYFINSNQVSQKAVKQISERFISYLSSKESDEFDNLSLIQIIDLYIDKNNKLHAENIIKFHDYYAQHVRISKELLKINEEEKKITDLKDFAIFEINKIEKIDPKIGEYENLLEFKKHLSKKDKILNALEEASRIFDVENSVNTALELIDVESDLFDELMNFLRTSFEKEKDKLNELDDTNIEQILDRIEELSLLNSRYGSVEGALEYLHKKREELNHYENISFEKKSLEEEQKKIIDLLEQYAKQIGNDRKDALPFIEKMINSYLKELFLENITLHVKKCEMYSEGDFEFSILLNNTNIKKISSGEYNRLRLAFIAVKNELKASKNGILILDEIDSNLSGKESMSIANVLKKISKHYQIFAISHHPQLSSCADQHFSIIKKEDESFIIELDDNERIEELSRMISGETINSKARDFAKELRNINK